MEHTFHFFSLRFLRLSGCDCGGVCKTKIQRHTETISSTFLCALFWTTWRTLFTSTVLYGTVFSFSVWHCNGFLEICWKVTHACINVTMYLLRWQILRPCPIGWCISIDSYLMWSIFIFCPCHLYQTAAWIKSISAYLHRSPGKNIDFGNTGHVAATADLIRSHTRTQVSQTSCHTWQIPWMCRVCVNQFKVKGHTTESRDQNGLRISVFCIFVILIQ